MTYLIPDDASVEELLDTAREQRALRVPTEEICAGEMMHSDTLVNALGTTYEAIPEQIDRRAGDGWVHVRVAGKWLRLTETEYVTVRPYNRNV